MEYLGGGPKVHLLLTKLGFPCKKRAARTIMLQRCQAQGGLQHDWPFFFQSEYGMLLNLRGIFKQ